MLRVRAWAAALAMMGLAGCVGPTPGEDGPDASACPSTDLAALNGPVRAQRPPLFQGTGRFVLEPAAPRLVPGQDLKFGASFTNPDCGDFVYRAPMVRCGATVLRIGTGPLALYSAHGPLNLDPPIPHSCGVAVSLSWLSVRPGETYRVAGSWNGSYHLWDHRGPEAGAPWSKAWFWAAPGDWPLSYGFDAMTSYEVGEETVLQIERNALNEAGGLDPGACAALVSPSFADAAVTVSTPAATIGTTVSVTLTYTLRLPAAGCFVLGAEPMVEARGLQATWRHSLGITCAGAFSSEEPFVILVRASGPNVTARIEYEWNGTAGAASGCQPGAQPGNSVFAFVPPLGGFAAAPAPSPVAFEWRSP